MGTVLPRHEFRCVTTSAMAASTVHCLHLRQSQTKSCQHARTHACMHMHVTWSEWIGVERCVNYFYVWKVCKREPA